MYTKRRNVNGFGRGRDGDGGRDVGGLNNGRWWLRAGIECSLGLFINRSSGRRNVHSLHFSSNLKTQDRTINKSVDCGACSATWGKCQCHITLQQTGHASNRCSSDSPTPWNGLFSCPTSMLIWQLPSEFRLICLDSIISLPFWYIFIFIFNCLPYG